MFYKSPVTTPSYQSVFIYFFCQQKHWRDLRRTPLGRVHLHKLVYRNVHMQPSQKQGYKHNQMPLWLHTEVYSHTRKHTWGSHGTSELTKPFIREPACSWWISSSPLSVFSAIGFISWRYLSIWMFLTVRLLLDAEQIVFPEWEIHKWWNNALWNRKICGLQLEIMIWILISDNLGTAVYSDGVVVHKNQSNI